MKVTVRATPKKAAKSSQQQPQQQRENRIIKFIGILRKDIDNFIHKKKDQKWEDYKRFCEIARGKR